LGKESGHSRLEYLFNFYKYIWSERRNYDFVLVHMNPIYAVLGGIFWILSGKKVGLWYNHPFGGSIAKIAVVLVNYVFYTSPQSFAAKYGRAHMMPAGIDTDLFKKEQMARKTSRSILSLGRISRVKKIGVIIEAARILDAKGLDFRLQIVGTGDLAYEKELKDLAGDLVNKNKIVFLSGVKNVEAPSIFNANQFFVNATQGGSLDKTVLEAMACESLVLVSNRFFERVLPPKFLFVEASPASLADKLDGVFALGDDRMAELGREFREYVLKNHGLDELVSSMAHFYETV
jgi:glycosyltransferase involved in cell wall biosynthesis